MMLLYSQGGVLHVGEPTVTAIKRTCKQALIYFNIVL